VDASWLALAVAGTANSAPAGRGVPDVVMAIYLYALAVLSGGTYIAAGAPPGSVSRLLPGVLAYSWYGSLTLGGVAGLTAAIWREPLTAVMIERIAMYPLGASALVYAVALALRGQVAVLFTAGIIAGFGVAALLRAVQITRQLRALHAVARVVSDDDR
jgi:hypothetical protein